EHLAEIARDAGVDRLQIDDLVALDHAETQSATPFETDDFHGHSLTEFGGPCSASRRACPAIDATARPGRACAPRMRSTAILRRRGGSRPRTVRRRGRAAPSMRSTDRASAWR